MNILLVCAGGLSTGLLIKKLKAYWQNTDEALNISTAGLADYEQVSQDADVILVGPQVAYRLEEIQKVSQKPCAAIDSTDYALGRCDHIFDLAHSLLKQ